MTWRRFIICLFLVYFTLGFLQRYTALNSSIALAFVAIVINWILPSFHIVLLSSHAMRRRFTNAEMVALTCWTGCIILPTLLLAEYLLLRTLSPLLPLLNSAALTILVFITQAADRLPRFTLSSWTVRQIIRSPLTWALLLQGAVSLILTTAFLALPDIDPYKWANWYALWVASPSSQPLPTRPLFYFFFYLFTPASHLEHYFFIKYVFPFISCLPILIGYVTVPRGARRLTQFTWLLLPLFSPSLILYLALPIPQSLFIICIFFFLHFVIHAAVTKDSFFYWLAGVSIFIAFFYHQAATLIIMAWALATLLGKYEAIFIVARRYKIMSLATTLAAAYIFYQSGVYNFIFHWLTKITALLKVNPNWYFPAHYNSIDGQSVGWANASGVFKYYAFYVGPPLVGILAILLLKLIRQASTRRIFQKMLTPSSPLFALILCATLFFTISEILPRLTNIALLPERSWLFGGIFVSVILWQLLQLPRRWPIIETIILGLISLSIGGAVYINYLKAHTIPDYQVKAAEWIKQNLPSNRIMISSDQPYVLTTNAESRILAINAVSLCNLDLTNNEYVRDIWYALKAEPAKERNHITEVYLSRIRALIATDRTITLADLEATSEHFLTLLNKNAHAHDDITDFKKRAYIYFTFSDPQNILLSRPYVQANAEATCIDPLFDQHPQFFEKVYDDAGRVMIWRFVI